MKPNRLVLAVAPVVLAVIGLSGCASLSPYAATVNGATISRSQLDAELNDISKTPRYVTALTSGGSSIQGTVAGTYDKSFVANILNRRIVYTLVHQETVKHNLHPSAADVTSAKGQLGQSQTYTDSTGSFFSTFPASYQQELAVRQAEVNALETVVGTADAVKQYYGAHPDQFVAEACVRHILLAVKDASGNIDYPATLAQANKIKAQLDAGADFATLAKADSQDNAAQGGSAANGGQLTGSATDGCLNSQDLSGLVTPFAQAAATAALNKVTDPVQTQFGYHLILVTSRKIAALTDQGVSGYASGQLVSQLIQSDLKVAKLKVNAEFGTIDTTNSVPQVVPPSTPSTGPTTTSTAPAPATPGSTAPPSGPPAPSTSSP